MAGNKHRSKRPVGVCIAILAATAGIALVGDDPTLVLGCGSVFAATVGLLWRAGEPPVLLMAAGLQLFQVVIRPLYASLTGVSLEDISLSIGDVTAATWFALAAMLSLVVGMSCGQYGARRVSSALQLEARTWTPRAAFVFCLMTLLFSTACGIASGYFDGLKQPLQSVSRIEWAGVFVLTYVCAAQRRGFGYLSLVAFFELISGFGGYFAGFKEIFVVLLIGVLAASPKLKPKIVLTGFVLAGLALTLGAFWSAIKSDYRNYISGGSYEQVVVVSFEDRVAYLMNRVSEVDGKLMRSGLDSMVKRLGYVDLLAATMRNVPAAVPFEDGALIGAAVMNVLQPRLFFPDKPSTASDTDIAVRYSGIPMDIGRNAENTSISLGYVAELYVDFGVFGALAATFILGLLFGRSVKFLYSSTALPVIVSCGFAVTLMMSVVFFEQSLSKTVGGFLLTFLAILALKIFVVPYLLTMFWPRATQRLKTALPK